MRPSTLLPFFASPLLILAKDGTSGCTSTTINNNVVFYVAGTGEICDYPADCGGGRAPPKYSVPGCPAYTGTETRPARYIPGYGPNAAATPAPASAAGAAAAAAPAALALTTGSSVSLAVSSIVSGSSGSSASGVSSATITTSPSLSSSIRPISASSTSTLRASNITTPSAPGTGSFNGEAGRVGAQVGLVAFFGAVLAFI